MTVPRFLVSIFILGFGSLFSLGHIVWGVLRIKRDGLYGKYSLKLFGFTKMDYGTAPGEQLILLGVIAIILVLIWYDQVFRTWL
jgi:hypothetical protein